MRMKMWHNSGMKDAAKTSGTDGAEGTSGGAPSALGGEDLRELARAMNRLADAINDLTAMAREAKAENPDWAVFPSTLIDLSKRLTTLATRLR